MKTTVPKAFNSSETAALGVGRRRSAPPPRAVATGTGPRALHGIAQNFHGRVPNNQADAPVYRMHGVRPLRRAPHSPPHHHSRGEARDTPG